MQLRAHGMKTTGNKPELTERLQFALRQKDSHVATSKCKANKRASQCESRRRAKTQNINIHDKSLVPTLEHQLNIVDLPTEILADIFDYLDIWGLSDVAKTCKRLKQIAGACYTQHYIGLNPECFLSKKKFMVQHYLFIPFFDKFRIIEYNKERPNVLYKFVKLQSEFHGLKNIQLYYINFKTVSVDSLKVVFRKLEYLQFFKCDMEDGFFENVFTVAPNIKRLSILHSRIGTQWLSATYPTLEHCEILSNSDAMPIATFLRLNPNIRKFGTDFNNLWENRFLLRTFDIELDVLAIDVSNRSQFNSLCQLLRNLHQIRFYKHLKVRISITSLTQIFDQGMVKELGNMTTMIRLYIGFEVHFNRVALSDLVSLGDLNFPDSRYILDIESVANRFVNLERIHFGISNVEHVKLFMNTSSKLKIIEIDYFRDCVGDIEENKVLNLVQLNNLRAKMLDAGKIILYVGEGVYLATKRANSQIDLNFVKLKRISAYNEMNFDFYMFEDYGKITNFVHNR